MDSENETETVRVSFFLVLQDSKPKRTRQKRNILSLIVKLFDWKIQNLTFDFDKFWNTPRYAIHRKVQKADIIPGKDTLINSTGIKCVFL